MNKKFLLNYIKACKQPDPITILEIQWNHDFIGLVPFQDRIHTILVDIVNQYKLHIPQNVIVKWNIQLPHDNKLTTHDLLLIDAIVNTPISVFMNKAEDKVINEELESVYPQTIQAYQSEDGTIFESKTAARRYALKQDNAYQKEKLQEWFDTTLPLMPREYITSQTMVTWLTKHKAKLYPLLKP